MQSAGTNSIKNLKVEKSFGSFDPRGWNRQFPICKLDSFDLFVLDLSFFLTNMNWSFLGRSISSIVYTGPLIVTTQTMRMSSRRWWKKMTAQTVRDGGAATRRSGGLEGEKVRRFWEVRRSRSYPFWDLSFFLFLFFTHFVKAKYVNQLVGVHTDFF